MQGSSQQQQYEQQLQQLTLRRLSAHQMQQLHELPVEQRAMHFGHYMRQTQLQLQQHHMQQQQQVTPTPVPCAAACHFLRCMMNECISRNDSEV